MLPVLCELQTEAVEVLPRTLTSLTLLGPKAVSGPRLVLELLVELFVAIGQLLTMHKGRPFEANEPLL